MVEYRHPDWKEDPKAARKAKREPAVAPQVHFESPMSKQPHVAILGGGMSGLVCALTLEELGIGSTVFDTVSSSLDYHRTFATLSYIFTSRMIRMAWFE
jgi:heterodisulfide reductase subunit A-like polyferredoxin